MMCIIKMKRLSQSPGRKYAERPTALCVQAQDAFKTGWLLLASSEICFLHYCCSSSVEACRNYLSIQKHVGAKSSARMQGSIYGTASRTPCWAAQHTAMQIAPPLRALYHLLSPIVAYNWAPLCSLNWIYKTSQNWLSLTLNHNIKSLFLLPSSQRSYHGALLF